MNKIVIVSDVKHCPPCAELSRYLDSVYPGWKSLESVKYFEAEDPQGYTDDIKHYVFGIPHVEINGELLHNLKSARVHDALQEDYPQIIPPRNAPKQNIIN